MGIEEDEIYAYLQEQYKNAIRNLIDDAVDQIHKELAKLREP